VRDPRKVSKKKVVSARNNNNNDTRAVIARHPSKSVRLANEENPNLPAEQDTNQSSLLPFQPSHQNQESIGSSLASYGLAGVGVAMGVTFVSALFGGF
jgi:hypothetical protein